MSMIWNNKNFVKLWFGQLVSILGDQIHFIALMVLIQNFFGDIVVTGTVMMVTALPKVLFSPFAGVLVDRWPLKMTMIVSDLIRMVLVLLIPLLFFVAETPNMTIIFVLTFLISTVGVFFYPAKTASIPTLVEKENLLTANSISGTTQMIISLAGLLGGAVLIALTGTTVAFIFDASTFLISAISVSFIQYPKKKMEAETENNNVSYLSELKSGAKYVVGDKLLRFMLIFFTSIMLIGGAVNVSILAYVEDVLKMDVSNIGYLFSANMVGMIIGMALITKITKKYPKEKLLIWSTFIFSISITNIAWTDQLYLVIPFMVINGLGNGILNVVSSTIFQEYVKESMRGRVFSVVDAVVNSAAVLSMLPAAWLIKTFSVETVLFSAGVLVFIIFIIGIKKANRIFKNPDKEPVIDEILDVNTI